MPLPPSGSLSDRDRASLIALLDLYRDWGVDCCLDETPPARLDRMAPIRPVTRERATSGAQRSREISPLHTTSPGASRPAPVDPEAARSWGVETLPDCALARTATQTVRPVFVPGASLMLIGDAPDAEEDRSGLVFAGETGRLLDMILPSIGLSRTQLSQAPAIPWRPPGGRAVSALEMRDCRPLLLSAIGQARPTRLVLFGLTPLRLLLGEQATLARARGKWTALTLDDGSHVSLLPMQHPEQLRTSPRARREMWKDLLLLAEALGPAPGSARESGPGTGSEPGPE